MMNALVRWKSWSSLCVGVSCLVGGAACKSSVELGKLAPASSSAVGAGGASSGDGVTAGTSIGGSLSTPSSAGVGGTTGTGIASVTVGGFGGEIGSVTVGATGGNGSVTAGGTGGSISSVTVGGAAGGPVGGVPIQWDANGWVDATSNASNIQGPWYSFDDCMDVANAGLTGCTTWGTPDMPGFTKTAEKVCAKGSAVQTTNYNIQWGGGIGFNLNSTSGAESAWRPYDAPAHGVTGFRFLITGTANTSSNDVRISMVTVENVIFGPHFIAAVPTPEGTVVTVRWSDPTLLQGSWVTQKVPFDPSELLALQIIVYTSPSAPTPFDFCVSDLKALAD